MACERYLNSIQESVDGTIGSIRRAELEMHLDECADCRALREDLQRIHDAAAALPVLEAPDRAWLQIAGRLRQEGRIREIASPVRASRPHYVAWLAAAAAVILAVAATMRLLVPRGAPPARTARTGPPAATPAAPAPGNAAPPQSVESAQNAVDVAQQQFEKAIENLEKVAKDNAQALDPTTSATIDKNLGIIDQAIADSRAVANAEPTNVAARETLFEALRHKVSLLQDTIALINEMRKGNNAAAAQLVNKS
jgi:hypothetical protein